MEGAKNQNSKLEDGGSPGHQANFTMALLGDKKGALPFPGKAPLSLCASILFQKSFLNEKVSRLAEKLFCGAVILFR